MTTKLDTYKIGLVSEMKSMGLVKHQPDDPFTLSSGKESPWYFDVKGALMADVSLFCIDRLLTHILKDLEPQFVGGPANAAYTMVPLACAAGIKARGFVMRKETKGHGLRRIIDGWEPTAGSKVVLLEDVITTGKSLLPVIGYVQDCRAQLLSIVTEVDRCEDCVLGDYRDQVLPLVTTQDFL